AKIFAAAGLLALNRVKPGERVSGEGGRWKLLDRTIVDEEPLPSLTLADAIRVSSNIALVKFARRLEPAEQYGVLRDFGFGVVTADLARRRRELLHGAAQRGTGEEGTVATFQIAAETGAAGRVVGGGYAPGEYTASFAALFPADHPQLVVVVKIDNPRKGSYFAAHTAAPVTRAMLQQALAARQVAMDRASLTDAGGATVALAAHAAPLQPAEEEAGAPAVLPWPLPPDSARGPLAARRAVPDVTGLPLREAVRA